MKQSGGIKMTDKPWGQYELYAYNEKCTVKIIDVKRFSSLSLQSHKKRNEFWEVISGRGKFTLGDKVFKVKKGDTLYIPRETMHRMQTGLFPLKVLEVSLGKFDETNTLMVNQTMVNPYTYTIFYVTAEPVNDPDPNPSDVLAAAKLKLPFGQ